MSFIEKYKTYVVNTPEGIWFRRKVYGWGWTPTTWEGWGVTLAYIIIVLGITLSVQNAGSVREPAFALLFIVLLTATFIRIVYKKGEKPPRWQWGFPEDSEPTHPSVDKAQ